MFSHFTRIALFFALFMGLALTAGSGANVGASSEAEALLKDTTAAMLELESFHFLLTTPIGKTLLVGELELTSIEGDFVAPDRFISLVTVSAVMASLEVTVIGIGDRVWSTDPFTGGDEMVPLEMGADGASPIPEYVNPEYLISLALASIQNPEIAGFELVNDVPTTLITGTIDPQKAFVQGTPTALLAADSPPLGVSIWIDDLNRIVRIEFDGPLLAAEEGTGKIIRRIDLSRFDEQVTIDEPATSAA